MLRLTFLFFISLFFSSGFYHTVQAQEEYEEWKENYLQEFQEFQNEYDKEFYETLKKEWKDFKAENSPDFYKKPKPKNIPTLEVPSSPNPTPQKSNENKDKATDTKRKTERNNTTKDKDENTATGVVEKEDDTPPKTTTNVNSEPPTTNSGFNPSKGISPDYNANIEEATIRSKQTHYFGIPINYKYYAAYETKLDGEINRKAISGFWKHLSTKDYPSFLEQIQQVRHQLSLNDYGYAQLLKNIGTQIYGPGSNEAILFTWFMLTQSNFDTKIAYKKQNIYLLIKATPGPRVKSATIEGTRYYNLKLDEHTPELSSFYTYQGSHGKEKSKSLNLFFNDFPPLPEKQEQRELEFTFRDSTYNINLPVDLQAIEYFNEYPRADMELYFNSKFEGETYTSLLESLGSFINGKPTLEKVNLLLRFTQNSFDYETDQEQFNYEKWMFPIETIYYPASDCDDRAIMFGYLIDHLTDLDYIVLLYPKHLAIAVHFPTDQEPTGNQVDSPIIHEGKRYYVSDPTYYGADAGNVMSQFEDTEPTKIFDF